MYCFCKLLRDDNDDDCWKPDVMNNLAFSSVSHFNLIHISCHLAAKSADAALRQPKREWEGATLRNGEVGSKIGSAVYVQTLLNLLKISVLAKYVAVFTLIRYLHGLL